VSAGSHWKNEITAVNVAPGTSRPGAIDSEC
jgi:hypothetical protein